MGRLWGAGLAAARRRGIGTTCSATNGGKPHTLCAVNLRTPLNPVCLDSLRPASIRQVTSTRLFSCRRVASFWQWFKYVRARFAPGHQLLQATMFRRPLAISSSIKCLSVSDQSTIWQTAVSACFLPPPIANHTISSYFQMPYLFPSDTNMRRANTEYCIQFYFSYKHQYFN